MRNAKFVVGCVVLGRSFEFKIVCRQMLLLFELFESYYNVMSEQVSE